jgi:hypothetical protein
VCVCVCGCFTLHGISFLDRVTMHVVLCYVCSWLLFSVSLQKISPTVMRWETAVRARAMNSAVLSLQANGKHSRLFPLEVRSSSWCFDFASGFLSLALSHEHWDSLFLSLLTSFSLS